MLEEITTSLWSLTSTIADPAERLAREEAWLLFNHVATEFGNDPAHWALADGAPHAVVRVALPYSLRQLSDWLAHGGMAQGAPPACACMS